MSCASIARLQESPTGLHHYANIFEYNFYSPSQSLNTVSNELRNFSTFERVSVFMFTADIVYPVKITASITMTVLNTTLMNIYHHGIFFTNLLSNNFHVCAACLLVPIENLISLEKKRRTKFGAKEGKQEKESDKLIANNSVIYDFTCSLLSYVITA